MGIARTYMKVENLDFGARINSFMVNYLVLSYTESAILDVRIRFFH